MIEVESILFEIIIIFLFIFCLALFVLMEFAILRVRTSEIEDLLKKNDLKAKHLKHIKDNIDKYISAVQLGITVISLLLGWIGESVFSKIFSGLLSFLGFEAKIEGTLQVIIGIFLLTLLTVSLGEVAPKNLAIRYAKKVSLSFAFPLIIFYRIFQPLIWLINVTANLFIKIFGTKPVVKDEITHTEDELRFLIQEGQKTGIIDSTEHQLIEKIFDFNDKVASDIMVPRNNIIAIDIDDKREKILQMVIDEGYSRIPVFKETIDNIIGIIYSKDLISAAEHREIIVLQDILRPAYFVPESKHIGDLLKDFQKKHIHLGIVIDEHGGVEGLITLEDIIEEIVGEIEDEYDIETRNIEKDKLGIYLVNPVISIDEFNKKFNSDIPEDNTEFHTLSGFLQNVTGHIPDIYERIDYKNFIFTVMKKTGNKLLQIKIQRLQ
jgi:CBS domain containing-hemolysin-like protein